MNSISKAERYYDPKLVNCAKGLGVSLAICAEVVTGCMNLPTTASCMLTASGASLMALPSPILY